MDIDREAVVQSFLVESDECLSGIEEALVALERAPESPELLDTVFRGIHTIKGNAFSLGFAGTGQFAHGVEDLLSRLRSGTAALSPGLVTLLLRCVDALRQMVCAAATGGEVVLPAHRQLLDQVREGVTSGGFAEIGAPRTSSQARGPGRRREDLQARVDRAHSLRVDLGRLDQLLDLTSEISIARSRLAQELAGLANQGPLETFREMDRLFVDMQELVMKVRMVPVAPVFRQFVRLVRDTAVAHGKLAQLVIEDEGVEIDTTVIEHLKDPLAHMVRNAIDHGIEPPDVRRGHGKPACGRVLLSARQEAGSIVISVADDGAGLDRERIVRRAVAAGLVAEGERLSDHDAFRLILQAGLSTAEAVTELSGRGVGMDVVRKNVELLRGSVALASTPRRGTTVTVRLPLTLAIIDGFAVEVAGETFILPLEAVAECLELPAAERGPDGAGVTNVRGEPLPYLRLRHQFGLTGAAPESEYVAVVEVAGTRAGIAVDALIGETQTVIKPLARPLGEVPGLSGCAILGNGRVALILDVPAVLARAARSARDEALPAGDAGALQGMGPQ
jgi:two-component system chemotaxis sensor kinase CheA